MVYFAIISTASLNVPIMEDSCKDSVAPMDRLHLSISTEVVKNLLNLRHLVEDERQDMRRELQLKDKLIQLCDNILKGQALFSLQCRDAYWRLRGGSDAYCLSLP